MRPTVPILALATVAAVAACSALPAGAEENAIRRPAVAEPRPPAPMAPRVEIIDDAMRTLPTFAHEGRRFVLGDIGQRYRVHIVNPTSARVEAVVSVDGLDAVDGKAAGFGKRGYVVGPYADVTIDGWRTSMDTVAAFRFSSVRESYAARTGSDRNVGVIGVAFFREQQQPPPPPAAWRGRIPARSAPAPARSGAGAAAESSAPASKSADRPGLGTEFGESHDSRVVDTIFVRAEATPFSVAEIRYDDRDGLVARGVVIPRERAVEIDMRDRAQPFAESRFAQPPR